MGGGGTAVRESLDLSRIQKAQFRNVNKKIPLNIFIKSIYNFQKRVNL